MGDYVPLLYGGECPPGGVVVLFWGVRVRSGVGCPVLGLGSGRPCSFSVFRFLGLGLGWCPGWVV